MGVTASELMDQVGATSEKGRLLAQRCVTLAPLYVTRYLEEQSPGPTPVVVPAAVLDAAVLACAEDIYTRSKSENGVILENYQPGDDGSGVVVRIGRDPLAPVRPLLRPWLPGVFAL